MRLFQFKRLYLPALSIVGVVMLLLVMISFSTYRNLDRDKTKALKSLHHQGETLLGALEAFARSGMMMPMWVTDSIDILIQEFVANEEIAYVYFVDSRGSVVHHPDREMIGKPADWHPELDDEQQLASRVQSLSDDVQIYEIAKRFSPESRSPVLEKDKGMMHHHHMIKPHWHKDHVVVLGLRMTEFEEARKADLHHAMIMAGILVVLGTGALFFIFVIQNYYLVDRTLKFTQDYTRQVIANMANGLLSINDEGRIVSCNRLALEYLGIAGTARRGMDLRTVLDFSTCGIDDTIRRGRSVLDREIVHSKPSGEAVPLALSVTPLAVEKDGTSGAVLVLRDLREIKSLEDKVRRSEKLAAVGRLAAAVAHEIRNPLSSIRGFARFLSHGLADRPQEQEYAAIMVREVDRINSVVSDLLTLARPSVPEREPVDVIDLIEHTIRLVEADAKGRRISIRRQLPDAMPAMRVDANQITQAILNLLLNALQAVPDGGSVEVGAGYDSSTGQLDLWVEDNGVGIPPEEQDKLFDLFFTKRKGGTGLGLAVVHKIVENHDGDIRVESPPHGKIAGSRFCIRLPDVEK